LVKSVAFAASDADVLASLVPAMLRVPFVPEAAAKSMRKLSTSVEVRVVDSILIVLLDQAGRVVEV
jgi:hypothetical protein